VLSANAADTRAMRTKGDFTPGAPYAAAENSNHFLKQGFMASDEPVQLSEIAETGDRFLIYATDGGVNVEVRYERETLWMTQAQMAALFGGDVSVISRHIANVVEEGELPAEDDLHFLQIRGPGNRPVTAYSLDMVISVKRHASRSGHRV
jgi:hypothetical protein